MDIMDIEKAKKVWQIGNESANGYAVGAKDHTPEEAALAEEMEVVEEDIEGNVLAKGVFGKYVMICDANGPWAVDMDLACMDLRGGDFRGVDLSGVDGREADFSDADLSGADLSGADLDSADFAKANLSGAKIAKANLNKSDFSGADLSGVDGREADFSDADLSGANLTGADLSGSDLSDAECDQTSFYGADLSGTNLRRASCREADWRGCNLSTLSADDLEGVIPEIDEALAELGLEIPDHVRADLYPGADDASALWSIADGNEEAEAVVCRLISELSGCGFCSGLRGEHNEGYSCA